MTLSARESEALDLICQSLDTWGEAPTRLELAAALGVSGPTAHLDLQRLAGKGLLTLERRRWRGIALRNGAMS